MKNLEEKENKKNEIDNLEHIIDNMNMLKKTVDEMSKNIFLLMLCVIVAIVIAFVITILDNCF